MDFAVMERAFGALFAVMNPFMNLPIFLALTGGFTVAEQRTLAVKVTLYSAIMSAVVLIAGQAIISFFGITIDEFRIAGGLVLAHIAWNMLNGDTIASHQRPAAAKAGDPDLSGVAFYPITFPMVVCPGSIATMIIYGGHAGSAANFMAFCIIVAVVLLIMFLGFYFAAQIGAVMSETMRVITTRIMGMILLAISVEMVAVGAMKIFPVLSRAG
ncbi:MAG: MarC family protein [Proteobacteria bacterium]|nr:MarC family protein [Pseudomonadota bacterium]